VGTRATTRCTSPPFPPLPHDAFKNRPQPGIHHATENAIINFATPPTLVCHQRPWAPNLQIDHAVGRPSLVYFYNTHLPSLLFLLVPSLPLTIHLFASACFIIFKLGRLESEGPDQREVTVHVLKGSRSDFSDK
jgi:hypothetical protein